MRATSESAEWIFLATNLGLEMLSAACDQASSPRRPQYAQFGMLLAIAVVLISIWELIYRGKKERVVLRRWGMLWWFYHPPPPRHTPFGTFPDIFGLVAGITQCICSIVQYVYCLRHADNPFKASLLPAVFLLCLGGSKLVNNRMNANTTDNEDSWENSSSMEENLSHAISISSVDYQEEQWQERQQEEEHERQRQRQQKLQKLQEQWREQWREQWQEELNAQQMKWHEQQWRQNDVLNVWEWRKHLIEWQEKRWQEELNAQKMEGQNPLRQRRVVKAD